jgi:glycosyltransferase involved in cell wall biosynthesis
MPPSTEVLFNDPVISEDVERRGRPRIGIIVLSAVADDPRVRRQGDAFKNAGWDVIGFGLPGGRSDPPDWPIVTPLDPLASSDPPLDSSLHPPLNPLGQFDPLPDPDPLTGPDFPNDAPAATRLCEPVLTSHIAHPIRSTPARRRRPLLDPERHLLARCLVWGYWRILRPCWVACASIVQAVVVRPLRKLARLVTHCLTRGVSLAIAACCSVAGSFWRGRDAAMASCRRVGFSLTRGRSAVAARSRAIFPHGNVVRELAQAQALRIMPSRADQWYWRQNGIFSQIYERARRHQVDVWLANDWTAAPIARRLALEQGVPYGYDTHELAVEEYAEFWHWRLMRRPFLAALEAGIVRDAKVVSCVSSGISRRMLEVHRMARPPLVIRNTPYYQEHAFRPTAEAVRVLYHGLVVPGRGIEECIQSLPDWPGGFQLTIRGPAERLYLDSLRTWAHRFGVLNRVTFAPPVPMTELVSSAAAFDVGVFVLPLSKQQNTYVLPNKLFEYLMAGLAVVVSGTPEMAEVVEQHQVGVLVQHFNPECIAEQMRSLEVSRIDSYKQNALKAARRLNWNAESRRLVAAYTAAIADRNMAAECKVL